MNILWLNSVDPNKSGTLHNTVMKGLRNAGFDVHMINPNLMEYYEMEGYDWVIANGLRKSRLEYARMMKAENRPFLVYDLGYLNRGYDVTKDYFQIGFHGIGWIPEFDCKHDRLNDLGVTLLDTQAPNNKRILVCGQKFNDAQHEMDEYQIKAWCGAIIKRIRAKTDREVVFRPHPKSFFEIQGVVTETDGDIEDAIQNSSMVVTFNSTAGVEAVRQGIPVFCDDSAHYRNLGNSLAFEAMDKPYVASKSERTQYFANLAYAQWNCKEILAGTPFHFLQDVWRGSVNAYKKEIQTEYKQQEEVVKEQEGEYIEKKSIRDLIQGKKWFEARNIVKEFTGVMPRNKEHAEKLICQTQPL